MAREIRVTFTDKEEELYNFIISKTSKSAFLKDLAAFEKERQERILNAYEHGISNNQKLHKKIEEDKKEDSSVEKQLATNKSKVGGFGR